ncbi:importin subunit alpha-4-like isoform X1 [Typha latifolia]|uniref:importin subunit alpha-4-like isoform X1 n=1 Tax=Typha latifolia TaxID=4733 RepID=UPI003C2AAD36
MPLRSPARTEVRKKAYKTGIDPDQARRRREENLVIIRKSRREENLLKKRRELPAFAAASLDNDTSPLVSVDEKLKNLPAIVQRVCYGDPQMQLEATTEFRKLLSIVTSPPPIEEVIKAGVVPWFVKFLSRYDMPELQFEAAWTLTNIACGTSEHTNLIIEQGAISVLVELLSSPCDDVREQAIWALGNIAGESPSCRDMVLHHGALIPLLAQLNGRAKMSMLRNATWTLSNLCRGTTPILIGQIRAALPVLCFLIQLSDEEVLVDACWSISYLSDGSNEIIQAIIESGVCPILIKLLLHPSETICIPALKTLGNIVTGDDTQTQVVIDNGALPYLFQLLTRRNKKVIKRHACWIISNITAGNKDQIQAVIDANIIHPLVQLLQNAEFDIKKEAAWALSNSMTGGSHDQIRVLVNHGCIKAMCALLSRPEPRVVTLCLDGLANVLKAGEAEKESGRYEAVNIYAQMIIECDGLDKIESLQGHHNSKISDKSVEILEKYWGRVDLEAVEIFSSFG